MAGTVKHDTDNRPSSRLLCTWRPQGGLGFERNSALTSVDSGADGRTRTDNRLFTRQVRYQLRHASRVPANATGGGPGLQGVGLSR